MKIILALTTATLLLLGACAHREPMDPSLTLMSEDQFAETLTNWTDHVQKYEGFYNVLDSRATLRNSPVMKAQMDQSARVYRWDRAKLTAEANKLIEKTRNETEVFLSFYTPTRANDDLHKSGTQWRVYLEVDGKRWEGKVNKIRQSVPEIQGLYPYHTSFATPYSITFTVPLAQVETRPSKFTVTGPMGDAVFNFASASPTAIGQ